MSIRFFIALQDWRIGGLSRIKIKSFIACFVCVFYIGCGGSSARQEKLVQATGTVKLDGRPTAGIRLYFQPVSGTKAVGGC